jgi:hypothetical protein
MTEYTYRPNDDEAAVAALVARRRDTLNRGGSNFEGGETASREEIYLQHYRACLAEIAVSRLTNRCWTGCGKGSLKVPDVGGEIEVRSIANPKHGLCVQVRDRDESPVVQVLVTTDRICNVMGWETFANAKKLGKGYNLHTAHPYWLYWGVLQPFETLPISPWNPILEGVE